MVVNSELFAILKEIIRPEVSMKSTFNTRCFTYSSAVLVTAKELCRRIMHGRPRYPIFAITYESAWNRIHFLIGENIVAKYPLREIAEITRGWHGQYIAKFNVDKIRYIQDNMAMFVNSLNNQGKLISLSALSSRAKDFVRIFSPDVYVGSNTHKITKVHPWTGFHLDNTSEGYSSIVVSQYQNEFIDIAEAIARKFMFSYISHSRDVFIKSFTADYTVLTDECGDEITIPSNSIYGSLMPSINYLLSEKMGNALYKPDTFILNRLKENQ